MLCPTWIRAKYCSPFFGSLNSATCQLSGPVLRDTARLSQRYPPIARYGVFGVSTWPIGCDTPSPFSEHVPMKSMRSGGAIPPPQKGYLSDTGAIPYEYKANGCDTPLCDTISKGYCAIWGGISHWAAKRVNRHWPLSRSDALRAPPIISKCDLSIQLSYMLTWYIPLCETQRNWGVLKKAIYPIILGILIVQTFPFGRGSHWGNLSYYPI